MKTARERAERHKATRERLARVNLLNIDAWIARAEAMGNDEAAEALREARDAPTDMNLEEAQQAAKEVTLNEKTPVRLANVSAWIKRAQALGEKRLVERLQAFDDAPTDTHAEQAQRVAREIMRLEKLRIQSEKLPIP